MLNRQELLELSQLRDERRPVVSLYLNVDRQAADPQFLTRFKNLRQSLEQVRDQYDDATWQAIERDLDKARATLSNDGVRQGQSVAIFADGDALWRSYTLPYETSNTLTVGEGPRLRPLFRLLQRFDRYLAILTDNQNTRLFMVTPAGAEALASVVNDVTPRGHTDGMWSESRMEHQRDAHIQRHFKDGAERAFGFFRERGFNGVVLLGTEETTSGFREELHPYLQNLVLASHPMPIDAPIKEIGERVLSLAHNARRERQHRLIGTWEDEVKSAGHLATAGLEQTLQAAQQGQIMTMLVQENLEVAGGRCQQCSALLIETSGNCPYCNGSVKALDDVIEALVASAFAQDAEVIFLANDGEAPRLTPHGGIGATLRFAAT
jgi:peptide subunit release factor 1 (eRF1)